VIERAGEDLVKLDARPERRLAQILYGDVLDLNVDVGLAGIEQE
jgi:hypothetical protein